MQVAMCYYSFSNDPLDYNNPCVCIVEPSEMQLCIASYPAHQQYLIKLANLGACGKMRGWGWGAFEKIKDLSLLGSK